MTNEFSKNNTYWISKSHMKVIFDCFAVTSIQELKEMIQRGFKGIVEDEKSKRTRLQNLKLSLEIWLMLKSMNYNLEDSIQIMNGTKELPEPALKLLQTVKESLDGKCDFCGHKHNKTNNICTEITCLCGVR